MKKQTEKKLILILSILVSMLIISIGVLGGILIEKKGYINFESKEISINDSKKNSFYKTTTF